MPSSLTLGGAKKSHSKTWWRIQVETRSDLRRSNFAARKRLEMAYDTSGWTAVALRNRAMPSFRSRSTPCFAGTIALKKCYVYLSDVSIRKRKRKDEGTQHTWEQAFRESRWFTRGWTLQELLASASVQFFSKEGSRLGDKQSLEQEIHEITGIPIPALRGSALSNFSTEQKFGWAKNRKTTREEDWTYSLLGIFEISMPVVYGEGRTNAVRRLKKEINDASNTKKYLRHLYVTDPRADKIRIEKTKDGLIPDSYHWVLENSDFKQWRNNQQSHLLWIKGDPGKGKTTLLCGIIDELEKSAAATHLLSFFYCQATDSRINNAMAVLRGLLYLIIDQQPSLISHIQKQHDYAGKTLFEDANACGRRALE